MTATEQPVVGSTVRAACPHDCPDTCAMLVTIADGRALEVRGDPDHPFTRGGLCVKVNNYVDKVYSSERLLYPMRRSGPKGSGRFERISWDDALDEIATRFRETIATRGAEAIMPVSYLGTEGILKGCANGSIQALWLANAAPFAEWPDRATVEAAQTPGISTNPDDSATVSRTSTRAASQSPSASSTCVVGRGVDAQVSIGPQRTSTLPSRSWVTSTGCRCPSRR